MKITEQGSVSNSNNEEDGEEDAEAGERYLKLIPYSWFNTE